MKSYKLVKRKFSCIPDYISKSDKFMSSAKLKVASTLPPRCSVNTSKWTIHNQQSENSCVGYATSTALEYSLKSSIQLSPLFIYWWARKLDKYTAIDGGARIVNAMKCLTRQGACEERYHKSIPNTNSDVFNEPNAAALVNAAQRKISAFNSLSSLNDIKNAIVNDHPAVAGVPVYSSLQSKVAAITGKVQYPKPNEKTDGGHAIVFTGYDDATAMLTFCNSWGYQWGYKGYGYLPYRFLTDLYFDAWEIII